MKTTDRGQTSTIHIKTQSALCKYRRCAENKPCKEREKAFQFPGTRTMKSLQTASNSRHLSSQGIVQQDRVYLATIKNRFPPHVNAQKIPKRSSKDLYVMKVSSPVLVRLDISNVQIHLVLNKYCETHIWAH